jgi:Kef-type K+ transport system membrane component KefB
MLATAFTSLLVQLSVMLVCGLAGGIVMRRLRQPAVVGEMLCGVVLGPTLLGAIAPEFQTSLFPTSGDAAALRNAVIKFGMLFFMFTVGLEINARGVLKNGRVALFVGLLGTLAPLAAGMALVYAAPHLFGLENPAHKFPLALFIGAAMANSANPVLARILLDLGLLKEKFGAIIMSATVIDDLVSWMLLFVAFEQISQPQAGIAAGVGSEIVELTAFFAGTLLVGAAASRLLAYWHRVRPQQSAGRMTVVAALLLLAAAVAESLEIHAFLGAFLFGVMLTPTPSEAEDQAYEGIRRFSNGVFVPIYFVSLGLTTDFAKHFAPVLVLAVILVACISKIPAAYVGGRLGGLGNRLSLAVGWGMNARGATGIILANLGLDRGAINLPTYVALVTMAIATSLAAAPMMKRLVTQHEQEVKAAATMRETLERRASGAAG